MRRGKWGRETTGKESRKQNEAKEKDRQTTKMRNKQEIGGLGGGRE